jgi:crotonobetainyl-CoA:carnitine CoA-transferase CaiB-like acyl-CoA transferase
MATQVLALLGADVIHVESASHPDGMRLTGAWSGAEDWWEYGHMFTAANAGKRGVTLDLTHEEGTRLLWRLLADADVYVENFSPRVTESFGLGFEEVRSANPAIVHLRMPAFGLTGPWRDRPAFAQIIEPMSTMAATTGFPNDRPVAKGGLPDPTAAWHGAFVALVGLAERERSGHGVALEAVMAEAALNVCPEPAIEWASAGHLVGRTGNASPHAIFQQVVPCRGSDEWLAVSVLDDGHADALLGVLSAQFSDQQNLRRSELVEARLAAWAIDRDPEQAATELRRAGIPAARCQDPRKLAEQPQLVARGLFEAIDHPVLGTHPTPGLPCRFASVEKWLERPAPTLGQHNAEVLGLHPAELERLSAAGVVGSRPNGL